MCLYTVLFAMPWCVALGYAFCRAERRDTYRYTGMWEFFSFELILIKSVLSQSTVENIFLLTVTKLLAFSLIFLKDCIWASSWTMDSSPQTFSNSNERELPLGYQLWHLGYSCTIFTGYLLHTLEQHKLVVVVDSPPRSKHCCHTSQQRHTSLAPP